MGSLCRSEHMKLCQLLVEKEAAYSCVVELGKLGCVQFKDLNDDSNEFQRRFTKEIQRCAEIERSLRYLEERLGESDIEIPIKPFLQSSSDVDDEKENFTFETAIFDLEKEVHHYFESDISLRNSYNKYVEYLQVLEKTDEFFNVHLDDEAMTEIEAAEIEVSGEVAPLVTEESSCAWFIAGVISWDKVSAFERVLWRACRRSAFVRHTEVELPLEDPITGLTSKKYVFIVFFKGECLKNIINKVCDGFNARQYPCPKSARERQTTALDIKKRMSELQIVIGSAKQQRYKVLIDAAEQLKRWQVHVTVRKAVYHTLNMFTFRNDRKFFVMECWFPTKRLKDVRDALDLGVAKSHSTVRAVINVVETTNVTPTFYETNKFTKVFQSIVQAYGVPSYGEINPAPFTIITFPFIFAVMFGDCAHGFLMFLAALFLVIMEKKIEAKKIKNEIFNIFYDGRYVILLMGLFSMYTGLLYNDTFSKSFNAFGTAWRNPYNRTMIIEWIEESINSNKPLLMTFDPKVAYVTKKPVWFGVDPIWSVAENRLTFLNSMKMKSSVIIGIVQMFFGLLLSYCNYKHSKSDVDIYTNFIPQLIFLLSLFGYLCLQIILKWVYFSVNAGVVFGQYYPGSFCAPSLLVGLVNMFMLKKRPVGFMIEENSTIVAENCALAQWYPNQTSWERFFLFCAILCIPVMLVGKPLYLLVFRSSRTTPVTSDSNAVRVDMHEDEQILLTEPGRCNEATVSKISAKKSDSKMDIIVYQAIHTIEFTLGCISHTASYLRLWALSLAHAQLSDVLWNMVFAQAFVYSSVRGYVILCISFLFFAILTFTVLVVMEGLSAFLHALRLHWVEFQSKFFQGQGQLFVPFSFLDIMKEQMPSRFDMSRTSA